MHKLTIYPVSGGNPFEVTSLINNLSWNSNENTLGVQLDFDMANTKNKRYLPLQNGLSPGDLVVLTNESEVFRGVIVTADDNGEFERHYTAFDFAFYLNKSKEIYQFNGIKGSEAIKKMLNQFNVPIGNIIDISTVINHIYFEKPISDIIKDILQKATNETGQKYRMEMRSGKFYIEKQTDLIIKGIFKSASNLAANDITSAISNPTRKRSIENMKNSIKVIVNNRNSATLEAQAKDDININKYGLLQDVVKIDSKNIAQAKNIATNLLKEFNKVIEEGSIETLGDDSVRAGRILKVEEPTTGLSGQYKIVSCNHTVSNSIHKMSIGLRLI